jgi:Uma2 family endonuclease
MPSTLELSKKSDRNTDRHTFNLEVWNGVVADDYFAGLPGKIETNAFGQVLMSPPPHPEHGQKQSEVVYQLRSRLSGGRAITECPLSTSDGIKGIDVAWMSLERLRARGDKAAYTIAPEICVEVISPSNSLQEMAHKKSLYFEAGALEVWFCSPEGEMSFFLKEAPDTPTQSHMVPGMPLRIETI